MTTIARQTRARGGAGRRPAAFSIIELLVVIGIIVLAVALMTPAIGALTRASRLDSGVNTVSAPAKSARALALQPRADLEILPPNNALPVMARYSGVAVIVTPSNELRLTYHLQGAKDGGTPQAYLASKSPQQNGFTDMPGRTYLKMPLAIGLAGIATGGKLVSPPFAVRFDANGLLVAGAISDNEDRFAYYDGDYDGKFKVSDGRPATYDPGIYDPDSNSYTSSTAFDSSDTVKKFRVPFEKLETVIGVVVYDKNRLWREYPGKYAGDAGADTWILANGRTLLFARYAGVALTP